MKFNLYSLVLFVVSLALIFAVIVPVVAQEETLPPEPTAFVTDVPTVEPTPGVTPAPDVEPGISPDEAADTLTKDIVNIIASWGAVVGAAGAILVGFAKYIPGLKEVNGPVLSIVINGFLMVGYWAAQHYGFLPQYQFGLGQIENIGQALLALVSAVLGSGYIHRVAVTGRLPVVGYQRTPS